MIIRPHRSTTYIDAAYSYRPSSVVCRSVLRKEDIDWVKKCMENEVEAPDQEVDQTGHGERLCEKIAKQVN